MPHEEQREKNIRLVTEVALDCFLANGIEKTKVADIALRSGLTERSAFRYFETKADLVLAASLLYWKRILERIDRMSHTVADGSTTGLQDAENVLICYSQLYRLDPNGMRFTLDAELTLHAAADSTRSKTSRPSRLRPPAARWQGDPQGTCRRLDQPEVDVREIYYNSYDAILGIMQRLSIGGSPSASALDYDSRMRHLSQMFVRALSGK